uniref:Major sperm protein n=1 Tax=Acrobeloides nanus TaxID=290746 RepID=A0A914CDG1_9BILA
MEIFHERGFKFEPLRYIRFYSKSIQTQPSTCYIFLKNETAQSFVFKIRASNIDIFIATPKNGFVRPYGIVRVTLAFNPYKGIPEDNNELIFVYYGICEESIRNFDEAWPKNESSLEVRSCSVQFLEVCEDEVGQALSVLSMTQAFENGNISSIKQDVLAVKLYSTYCGIELDGEAMLFRVNPNVAITLLSLEDAKTLQIPIETLTCKWTLNVKDESAASFKITRFWCQFQQPNERVLYGGYCFIYLSEGKVSTIGADFMDKLKTKVGSEHS